MGECLLYGNGSGSTSGCQVKLENYKPMGEIHFNFPSLSARYGPVGTSAGDKALIGGGYRNMGNNMAYYNIVDVYTSEGNKTNFAVLSAARRGLAATTVGGKALFGGGYGSNYVTDPSTYFNNVDGYTAEGGRTTFPALSVAREGLAATTVGDKALFGGGTGTGRSDVVDAYTAEGARSTFPVLSVARTLLAATTVGNKALFGGGNSNEYSSIVDAYTAQGTITAFPALSVTRRNLVATTVGNKALFGGGYDSPFSSNDVVDAYTVDGARTTFPSLSMGRGDLAAATVGDKAMFGGGESNLSGGIAYRRNVDAYTAEGARSILPDLSEAMNQLAAAAAGNKAVFGGGISRRVDAYIDPGREDPYAHIPVLGGGVYNFGSGDIVATGNMLNVNIVDTLRPVNGYIKYKGVTING